LTLLRFLTIKCGTKFEKCDLDKFFINPNSITKEYVDKEKKLLMQEINNINKEKKSEEHSLNLIKKSKMEEEQKLKTLRRQTDNLTKNNKDLHEKYTQHLEMMKNLDKQIEEKKNMIIQ